MARYLPSITELVLGDLFAAIPTDNCIFPALKQLEGSRLHIDAWGMTETVDTVYRCVEEDGGNDLVATHRICLDFLSLTLHPSSFIELLLHPQSHIDLSSLCQVAFRSTVDLVVKLLCLTPVWNILGSNLNMVSLFSVYPM